MTCQVRELFYYPDGRMNNVDVRYNFLLGGSRVGLVGVSNRSRSLDFYKVNVADRSLTKVGSFAPGSDITTPRGFALYHSPVTGKYSAYVTDSGKTEQWELDGSSGSVTGRLVRKWTLSGPAHSEGLVTDDEMGRLYVAQEDAGGIWRYGAEPGDSTAGTRVVSTTENGGDIAQDIKGIAIYYGGGGAGTFSPPARAPTGSTPTRATTTVRWATSRSWPGTVWMRLPAWTVST